MSFLSLDIGNKRIGMAMGSSIAEEYGTLQVTGPAKSFFDGKTGSAQAIKEIKKVVEKERIEKIIIGNPVNDNGSVSQTEAKIAKFVEILKATIDIEVVLVDETLTSFVAEEMLKEEGLSVKDAKLRVDQVAAKLILQQYIEEE